MTYFEANAAGAATAATSTMSPHARAFTRSLPLWLTGLARGTITERPMNFRRAKSPWFSTRPKGFRNDLARYPHPLARPLCPVPRDPDDRPRHDDRERRAAVVPGGSRL